MAHRVPGSQGLFLWAGVRDDADVLGIFVVAGCNVADGAGGCAGVDGSPLLALALTPPSWRPR